MSAGCEHTAVVWCGTMTIIFHIVARRAPSPRCSAMQRRLSCAEDLTLGHHPGLRGAIWTHWFARWYRTLASFTDTITKKMSHRWVKTKCHLQAIRKKKANPNPSSLTFLQHPHLRACSSRRKAGSATGIQAKGHLQGCGKGRQMGCLTVKVPCYNSAQPFHWDSLKHQTLRRRSYSQQKGSYWAP